MKPYRRVFIALATLVLIGITATGKSEQPKPPVKLLVVTGVEYHDWRATAPQIAAQLASSPDIDVTLDTNINVLCADEIFGYDVLFFNFVNLKEYNTTLNDELALDNIEKFLSGGGGIIIYHLAIGIFERDFPKRAESIIGKYYDRALPAHDPFREFGVKITNKEHPITKNISDFRLQDELYTCLSENNNEIEVLATAYSVNVKKDYPMAHLFKFGKGHVFTTVLGHDTRALQSECFVSLLRNAVLWLAKRDVPAEPMKVVPSVRPIEVSQ